MTNPTPYPTLLFAGLGAMGHGMATHLLRSGFPIIGYDVHAPSMLRLVSEGGSSTNTPREAAPDVSILLIMVANHTQATTLLFDPSTGAVARLKDSATIIICSTVAPAYIAFLETRLKELGPSDIRLIDAPVSGGAARAADGTLSVFSSGEDKALFAPHVQSILACLSDTRKLYHVPGGLGGGSKAKLIHQMFAGVNIAVASETMGLAAAAGLDTRKVFEELCGGEGASWMFGNRVPFMLDAGLGRYSAVTIIAKDVGIVTATAGEERFPLPMVAVAQQLYAGAISAGWGAEDDCVVVRLYLPGKPGLVRERAGKAQVGDGDAGGGIAASDIEDLMVGVHLAAMSEAMSFCEHLGIDVELMRDIVSNAAGASKVFERYFGQMKKAGWGLNGVEEIEDIQDRLVRAVLFNWTTLWRWANGLNAFLEKRSSKGWGAEVSAVSLVGGSAGVLQTAEMIGVAQLAFTVCQSHGNRHCVCLCSLQISDAAATITAVVVLLPQSRRYLYRCLWASSMSRTILARALSLFFAGAFQLCRSTVWSK